MTLHNIQRAVSDADIVECHPILFELRSHLSPLALLDAVRRMEKEGYRLAFLVADGRTEAVVGYRIIEMLRTGKMLEIDDLVTRAQSRSKGYGRLLYDWVLREATENQCNVVELDSAVHRADAHRFYFKVRMKILAFHFSMPCPHSTDQSQSVV